ncbi:aldehyde ferredoxin oxidoreductase family protein [Chloroflexota bacterium]
MFEFKGWAGKILNVDLTTGNIEIESLDREWAIKCIGGSGFGAGILYDEVGPEVDALSPENISIITAGPLSGTLAPTSGRCELITKSPLTGIFGRSNVGGNFGPEMKFAGYDLIIIRGKAEKPVYLWIEDDRVELRDASHLWGQTVWSARDMICSDNRTAVINRRDFGSLSTLLIGPAGENLSLASCIIGGLSRAAAKTGMGAVWGSKSLKGIAVRGSKDVKIAKPAEFLQLCKALWQRFKDDPLYETHRKYGTLSWVGSAYSRSAAGKAMIGGERNESVEDFALAQLFERNLACFSCPLHCGHFFNIKEGKYKGTKGEGIEATLQMFAIGLRTFNTEFLYRYYNLCSQLGLNLEAPAAAINWAMHLYEAGIITKADADGIEVTWGNEDVVLELLRKIAYREGFGELLDDHPIRAAQRLGRGSDKYASHTKGAYTYNFGAGIGTTLHYTLALNTATRGHDAENGPYVYTPKMREEWGINDELLTKLGQERYNAPNIFTEPWAANPKKAQVVSDVNKVCAIADMTGMCKFATTQALCVAGMDMQDFSEFLSAATGEIFTADYVDKCAEREVILERVYNAREGIRRMDDYPFFLRWQLEHGEPNPLFNYEQLPVTLETYDIVLDEYYRLLDCDPQTGIPTRARLEELGLRDVADDLERRGVIQKVRIKG